MKKTLSIVVSLLLLAGLLSGCGSSTTSETTSSPVTSPAPSAAATAEESSAEEGKILVVYYSATGHTKAVAETIAESVGADLFEIVPAEPYTEEDLNWSNNDSRVVREHENEDLQNQVELETTVVDGWENYETIFFGYPIWWGNAAWPVNQFVQNNDFSGKTVIPFCTSSSSGIGQSGENLAQMAGTGNWKEGQRFSSNEAKEAVSSWAQEEMAS
jgi:flavodoxin